ncbi:MAG TPA: tripartite tricarboxylate transporter substrate-binding protein [Candidatus Binatia bacterium]|jgi:tripartite-type tricarboxylate transporter receptor subunit TctC|nr:tripartite tricarboxylate transporter substrate-binding protein [Candidatus Binatia bacterium]
MKRVLFLALALIGSMSELHAQAPFYQGKTVTFLVGSSAGTAYDIYARLLAAHIGKYLPGNPTVIVQNMPAAGGLVAANYVYGVAKPDGLTLASINPAHYFNQLQGNKEVKFDWPKFSWIGSMDKSEHMLYMRSDAPYKSIQDIRKATEPPKCGATGTGTSGHYIPRMLEETLGTKFTIVTGYAGGTEIDLATERNEVVCRSFTTQAYFQREPYHTWRKKGFVRILMQTGRKRDPLLPDTPLLTELMDEFKTSDLGRRVAIVMLGSGELGRPVVASPATPPDRTQLLREAFMKSVSDPALLEEAKQKKLDITPVPGEELAKIARDVIDQPQDVVERIRKILGQ